MSVILSCFLLAASPCVANAVTGVLVQMERRFLSVDRCVRCIGLLWNDD